MKKYYVLFRNGAKDIVYSLMVHALSFRDASKRNLVISMCNNPRIDDVESLLIIRMVDGEYQIFDV